MHNVTEQEQAHKYSSDHREQLLHDNVCGCFYCLNIFSPEKITNWLGEKTAVCPYCGIDAVIGESSGYPITKEFLQKMKNYWF
ncbi:MAG: cytoplasmic protein [Clostridia bacterium]|nr:cytoplasmic protein [Clostridia bacterium]